MPATPEQLRPLYVVDPSTGEKPYETASAVLAAANAVGDRYKFEGDFRFLALNEATAAANVEISWDGSNNWVPFPIGVTIEGFFGRSFWVRNTSGSANTVTFYKGNGKFTDNRIVLSALAAIPISMASGAVASGAYAAGAFAAGAFAAGAMAAGSVVAGAFVTGAIVDLGLKADAEAGTDDGTFSLIALVKRLLATKLPDKFHSFTELNAANSTNATNLKASAGIVWSCDLYNPTAGAVYFRLYNLAATPTVGADVAIPVIKCAANSHTHVDWPHGLTFASGIGFAITNAEAVTDATAVAAGALQVGIQWQ